MKYRLNLPEMIRKEDIEEAASLKSRDGQILEYIKFDQYKSVGGTYHGMIKKEWLEEIKDEPMSPDEWMEYNYKIEYRRANHYHFNDMKHAFKAGEENQKKRNKPTTTPKEALKKYSTHTKSLAVFMGGWDECLKAHGLSEPDS